jgi:hypothetical protein
VIIALMDQLSTGGLGVEGSEVKMWLRVVIEFNLLKHKIYDLQTLNYKKSKELKALGENWPQRKLFLDRANQLLAITHPVKPVVRDHWELAKQVLPEFLDYTLALQKVLNEWYNSRLQQPIEL